MSNLKTARKLNRLSAQLYQRSLTVEASLVLDLEGDIYKEAGLIDSAEKTLGELKTYFQDPDIMQNISLCIKVAGMIATLFPATAPAGPAIIKLTAGLDIAAAIGYFKAGDILNCIFSIISALVSVPSGQMSQIYGFMMSERFVTMLTRFKALGHTADTAAFSLAYFVQTAVPTLIDCISNLISGLISAAEPFAARIAAALNLKKDDVFRQLTSVMTTMNTDINTRLGVLI